MPVGGVTTVAIWEPLFSECETILGSLELSGGTMCSFRQGHATMTARKKQPRRDSA